MADIFQEFYSPAELTAVAREMLAAEDFADNQFRLAQWFPIVQVDDVEFKWKMGTTRDFTAAAPFRNFDVAAHIGTRPGRKTKSGEMPPISMEYPLTEYDAKMLQQLAKSGPNAREVIEGDVFDDIFKGLKALEARMEIARADALVDGTTTVTEKGISLTANWGRTSRSATVATPWSTSATATPMNDEESALDVLNDNEGLGPQDLVTVMNRATWREYKATTQFRNAFPSFRVMDRLSMAAVNEVRADNDFPELVIYNAQVRQYNGSTRFVIPNDKVLILPRGAIGQTQYGIPPSAIDPRIETNDEGGPVSYQTVTANPYQLSTVIDGLGFPVFMDTQATYVLTV